MKNQKTKRVYQIDSDYNIKLVDKKKIDEEKKTLDERNRLYEGVSLATELGFSIAMPLVIGALIGSYLDDKWSIKPKMTLSLMIFGSFISIASIYQVLKRHIK